MPFYDALLGCCGFGRRKRRRAGGSGPEREPLLARYGDDDDDGSPGVAGQDETVRQAALRRKLHALVMAQAVGRGLMPSTAQLVAQIRALLAAEPLGAGGDEDDELGRDGKRLAQLLRQWLEQLAELLEQKNGEDGVQDLVWYLARSRVDVNVGDIAWRAGKAKERAHSTAVRKSLQTVTSLLLSNNDFRLFLADLKQLGSKVSADSAFAVSSAANEVGTKLQASEPAEGSSSAKGKGLENGTEEGPAVGAEPEQPATQVLADAGAQVAVETRDSLAGRLGGGEGDRLLARLHGAVLGLMQRQEYRDSAPILADFAKQVVQAYARSLEETVDAVRDDVNENAAVDRALAAAWKLARSFGDKQEWDALEASARQLVHTHGRQNADLERFAAELGDTLHHMLTDPDFFADGAKARLGRLADHAGLGEDADGGDSNNTLAALRHDVAAVLGHLHSCILSAARDPSLSALFSTGAQLVALLSPLSPDAADPGSLLADALAVFAPRLISLVQCIPIPRFELTSPDLDLLLEPLILEPGGHGDQPSFLPRRIKVSTYSDAEVRLRQPPRSSSSSQLLTLPRVSAAAALVTVVRFELQGLSLAAEDVGFVLRAHKGLLLRFAASGVASAAVDGLDVAVEVEIRRDRAEQVLRLRDVIVRLRGLDYTFGHNKLGFFATLIKPLLRPVLERVVEVELGGAIAGGLQSLNAELVAARERLRAAQAAAKGPADWRALLRALAARWTSPGFEEDEDAGAAHVRVAWSANQGPAAGGVFEGVYAPGSLVKVWREEQLAAEDAKKTAPKAGGKGDWRSPVFDAVPPLDG